MLEDSILKPSRQSCMRRVWEISLISFLLVFILKKVQTRLMVKQIGTMSQLSATGHTISEWLEAQAEAGNSISNGEIYPPLFFEITHPILK